MFNGYSVVIHNLYTFFSRPYIATFVNIIAIIANVLICSVLAINNVSIHILKLTSSFVFVIKPIILAVIVNRRYHINWHEKYETEPLKQKWNAFAQNVAAVVLANTDVVILTFFSLTTVSIYSVYYMIVSGIAALIAAIGSGVQPMLGDMLARGENDLLRRTFKTIEWGYHSFAVLLFSITYVLIWPFISIYTKGVTDADYYQPVFALILCIAYCSQSIKSLYNSVVLAAGHFRQTQSSAFIEALINIVISIIGVFQFGLVGVAVGTLSAMIYRTVSLAK